MLEESTIPLRCMPFPRIGHQEGVDKKTGEIIDYAAILHDIGIKESERKYNSSMGKYQEIEGPPIAGVILSPLKISGDIIDRVRFIVGNHHSYSSIDDLDFQIVVEADFLVNIFEEEMPEEAIKRIKNRIFKTEAGLKLIESIYLH